jgi:prepilin signal peptidase PulO-like enzyme (type II secretory pathway)
MLRTVTRMLLIPALSALAAAGGAVAGPAVARFSARRSARQPITVDLKAEATVLGSVLAEPGWYPAVAELTPQAFADETHARIWARIQQHVTGAAGENLVATDESDVTRLAARMPDLPGDELTVAAMFGVDAAAVLALRDRAATTFDELIRAGQGVLVAWEDRSVLNGVSPIEATGDTEHPLRRRYLPPRLLRQVVTAVLLAVFLGSAPLLTAHVTPLTGAAMVLAMAAVAVLGTVSVVVALVDWDTMYIDLPVFWYGSAAAWVLSAAALVVGGHLNFLLPAAIALGVMFFWTEGVMRVYSKLRGLPMSGFGDTQILTATAGIPAALTGNVALGLGALVAAAVLVILVVLPQRLIGRHKSNQPFAFGPYLALGWLAAWAAVPLPVLPAVWSSLSSTLGGS